MSLCLAQSLLAFCTDVQEQVSAEAMYLLKILTMGIHVPNLTQQLFIQSSKRPSDLRACFDGLPATNGPLGSVWRCGEDQTTYVPIHG